MYASTVGLLSPSYLEKKDEPLEYDVDTSFQVAEQSI
jgi:hypothetical protein